MIVDQAWPTYDEAKTIESSVEIPVQVSGKLRATIVIERGEDQASVVAKAKEKAAGYLEGKSIVKEIYVPDKLINLVAK